MNMAKESKYINDPGLVFLKDADWKDLKLLAEALIQDFEGNEQWSGELKATLEKNKKVYPESEEMLYKNSWKAIAAEIQLFGGQTFVNLFRGQGVQYSEILNDVATKVNTDFHKDDFDVSQLEEKILRTLFGKITSLTDLNEMNVILKNKGYLGFTSLLSNPLDTIKVNVGLESGAKGVGAIASRFIGFQAAMITAPIVAIHQVGSPAYRVTIPVVCIVAMLRIKFKLNQEDRF